MAKRGRPSKKTAAKTAARKPRQQDLPGTVPKKIASLHNAAMRYAEIRDERMELTREEVELKTTIRAQMHKHGLTAYANNGVSITLLSEEEVVKVRVKKPGEDDEAGDDTDSQEAQESVGAGDSVNLE